MIHGFLEVLFFKILAPIPKIEASVPSTVLADMFGKATSKVIQRLGLTANGWMHFGNAAKGIFGMFANTAPQLGPCLGLLGVGFGFINKELNSVKPAQIINEVNKAIDKVVEQTNRRIELLEEYVDESIRKNMKESMEDIYLGQFRGWNRCLKKPTKAMIDACQMEIADDLFKLKYNFFFQSLFPSEKELPKSEIKALELQLPILKKWSDFHFLVLAALIKTLKQDKGTEAATLYENYKSDFVQDGNYNVAYMEWALEKIRKARIDNNNIPEAPTCDNYEDDIGRWWMMPTNTNIKKSSRRCSFKCDKMRPDYCDLTRVLDCTTSSWGYCILCRGLTCNYDDQLASFHYYLRSSQDAQRKDICKNYMESLTGNFTAFWKREIEVFLPITKEIIRLVNNEAAIGKEGRANKRQGGLSNDTKDQQQSAEGENDGNKKFLEDRDKGKESALKGITSGQSLEEYLATVRKNTKAIWEKKIKKKTLKKQNKTSD